jgi:hypothetical protein
VRNHWLELELGAEVARLGQVEGDGQKKRNPGMPLARLTQCHHASAHPGQVPSAFGRGRALPVHQSLTVHNMSSYWHARHDTFQTSTIGTIGTTGTIGTIFVS